MFFFKNYKKNQQKIMENHVHKILWQSIYKKRAEDQKNKKGDITNLLFDQRNKKCQLRELNEDGSWPKRYLA